MNNTTRHLIAALLGAGMAVLPAAAQDAEPVPNAPAPEDTPADANANEPTLDDLLGLGEGDVDKPEPAEPMPDDPDPDAGDPADPELSRELEQRFSGEQASEQFAQAIQEMETVAIRLGDQADPGIDTQRMQDQIILKLEQIIASAEKSESQQQQQQQQGGQPQPGPPRQADQGGQPNPGQQPGQQPGEQQANQPGEQPGQQQGEQPGEQQVEQPGQQANGQQGTESNGDNARQGSVRNEELSMQELREGEWGQLPPRLRDELAESLSESFNPVYRAATEAFYRRIAELSQQQAEGAE